MLSKQLQYITALETASRSGSMLSKQPQYITALEIAAIDVTNGVGLKGNFQRDQMEGECSTSGATKYLISRYNINKIHSCFTIQHKYTLRKLQFHFLSNWFGYDLGDGFPYDFEPNGISIWFKIEWKTVTTIIPHSIGKEMEM